MKRMLLALIAGLAMVAGLAQPAAAAESVPKTSQWAVTASPDSAITSATWSCKGSWIGPQVERDSTGAYIFFGGRQECTQILSQTLEVYLDRKIGSDWVSVSRAYRSAVTKTLQATTDSSYCSDTSANQYRIEAYGTASGYHSNPWPAVSGTFTLNCRLIAF